MEVQTNYKIESLSENNVTIVTKDFIEINGNLTQIGFTKSCCFSNCSYDRNRLESLLPANYFNAIISVWGETPSLEDPIQTLEYTVSEI